MPHLSPRLLIGLTIVALLALLTSAAADAPKVEELLARYEAFVDGLRIIAFDSLGAQYEKGGPFADWTWTWTFPSSYARAGDRWRLRSHSVGFNYYEHAQPMDSEREDVFDGKSYLMVIRDDRGARELTSMDEQTARRRLEIGGQGPWRMDVSAEVDAEKPIAAGTYAIQEQTRDLYGYIWVDKLFVSDLLRRNSPHLRARGETIDGRPHDVLECVTSHGTLTLWLDPASNHVPRRLRLRKVRDDLMEKTPMRLQKAQNRRWARPNLPVRQYELYVDYRPILVGDRAAISGYVRNELFTYEGGPEFSIRLAFNLDHIRFDPRPEDLEPTLSIPEDTNVLITNAPGICAKWTGGKLVMGYDKPTVASLRANWASEPSTARLWRRPLVLTTAGIFMLVAGALAWRRFSKSAA